MRNDSSFTEPTVGGDSELKMDGAALLEKLPLISRTLISLSVLTGGERHKLHLMNWFVASGLVHSARVCARPGSGNVMCCGEMA